MRGQGGAVSFGNACIEELVGQEHADQAIAASQGLEHGHVVELGPGCETAPLGFEQVEDRPVEHHPADRREGGRTAPGIEALGAGAF